jgi:hypothetical protein
MLWEIKMAKTTSSILVLGLTAVSAFSILFATSLITEPILEMRMNQRYLDLLNLDSIGEYEVGNAIIPTGELFNAGIIEIKPFYLNNRLVAVVYAGSASGFSATTDITFRLGIREGIITQLVVDSHGESAGYGADVLVKVPETIQNIAIEEESLWTSRVLAISSGLTGSTITKRGIINVLKAIRVDYIQRSGN